LSAKKQIFFATCRPRCCRIAALISCDKAGAAKHSIVTAAAAQGCAREDIFYFCNCPGREERGFFGTRMGGFFWERGWAQIFFEREWARMFARMDANLDVDRADFLERGWAQIFWNANGRECLREWTRI
jgi:hypothetical protein